MIDIIVVCRLMKCGDPEGFQNRNRSHNVTPYIEVNITYRCLKLFDHSEK